MIESRVQVKHNVRYVNGFVNQRVGRHDLAYALSLTKRRSTVSASSELPGQVTFECPFMTDRELVLEWEGAGTSLRCGVEMDKTFQLSYVTRVGDIMREAIGHLGGGFVFVVDVREDVAAVPNWAAGMSAARVGRTFSGAQESIRQSLEADGIQCPDMSGFEPMFTSVRAALKVILAKEVVH